MTRRSAGFVSKKPHRKSRGGCTTCKRKKIKCDEFLPRCSYCSQRNLRCLYPSTLDASSETDTTTSDSTYGSQTSSEDGTVDSPQIEIPSWLVPAAHTAIGQLTGDDFALLHRYKAETWNSLTVREEKVIQDLNREWIPQQSISRPYLLYTILSITARYTNAHEPSPQMKHLTDVYRQKAFSSFNKALTNISNENYETLLVTALFMQIVHAPPEFPCDDDTIFAWISSYLQLTQGLRILAGLKWASGIEKLTIFPIFRRELRSLPPPPPLPETEERKSNPSFYMTSGPIGDTPAHPDPPAMYTVPPPALRCTPSRSRGASLDLSNLSFRPKELSHVTILPNSPPSFKERPAWWLPAPAFLPPPLMQLLRSIVEPPDTGPIDLHRSTLLPVLHALSPIFMSLYYFHVTPDLYVRITTYPTFLFPDFLTLVREREPRALVIIAWFYAFLEFLPMKWWFRGTVPRIMQAVSDTVMRGNCGVAMDALEGACRLARVAELKGVQFAARAVFQGWDGVSWDDHADGRDFEEWVDWEGASSSGRSSSDDSA